jgi:hypothetical protein
VRLLGFLIVGWLLLPMTALGAWNVNGVSLAHTVRGGGYGSEACREQLKRISDMGGNWIAVSDFAWMSAVDQPHVRYGESDEAAGMPKAISDAHAAGLKVMVKPHLWSRDFHGRNGQPGKWHGDIRMTSERDWATWFSEYGDYILAEARIASQTHAEALCIGVEYDGTLDQEQRWRTLIARVRAVYAGKLTYASSCWAWKKIKWWDALDCIGIDAYFPIASVPDAGDAQLRAGWEKVYADMEPTVRRLGKQVCFTELGYTASADAGEKPWAYDVEQPSIQYQARLYRIAIEEARKRDYVVGAFVWKWFTSSRPHPPGATRWRGDPFAVQDCPEVLAALRDAWDPNSRN